MSAIGEFLFEFVGEVFSETWGRAIAAAHRRWGWIGGALAVLIPIGIVAGLLWLVFRG